MSQVKYFFETMHARFQPEAAQGVTAVFQYELKEGDQYYMALQDGSCVLSEGLHSSPSVTLKLKFATLQKLASGELDGVKAVLFGKLKVNGDMMLATRLTRFFPAA